MRRTAATLCLLLLPLSVWASTHTPHAECSREESRLVTMLFEADPDFAAFPPRRCALAAASSRFAAHEGLKKPTYNGLLCTACGRAFYSHAFLDRHLEKEHANLGRADESGPCAAELCGIASAYFGDRRNRQHRADWVLAACNYGWAGLVPPTGCVICPHRPRPILCY